MPRKKDDPMDRVEMKLDLFKDHFDDHMRTVGDKLEKMDNRLDNVDVTMVKQQVVLDEHVRRTNLLEEKTEAAKKELEEKIEPLKNQSSQIKLFLKIGAALLGAGGAGFGVKELLGLFNGF